MDLTSLIILQSTIIIGMLKAAALTYGIHLLFSSNRKVTMSSGSS